MATFDATTDFIRQGNTALPSSYLSISLWAVTTWAHTDGAQHYFFSWYADANNFFTLLKHSDNGLYFGWKALTVDYRTIAASNTYSIASGVPVHIASVTDVILGQTTVYVNGVAVGLPAGPTDGAAGAGTAFRYIGNIDSDVNGACEVDFAGTIEHFAIWNRLLTAGEVLSLSRRASPASFAPLNYLPLTGGSLADYGSSPVAGTNNNTASSNSIAVTTRAAMIAAGILD